MRFNYYTIIDLLQESLWSVLMFRFKPDSSNNLEDLFLGFLFRLSLFMVTLL